MAVPLVIFPVVWRNIGSSVKATRMPIPADVGKIELQLTNTPDWPLYGPAVTLELKHGLDEDLHPLYKHTIAGGLWRRKGDRAVQSSATVTITGDVDPTTGALRLFMDDNATRMLYLELTVLQACSFGVKLVAS